MEMKKHHFTIKIKGTATYNADSIKEIANPSDIKKPVTDFKDEVEKLLSEYQAQIREKLNALTPVKINPVIDGEFFFDGVEDEARE